ncbi:MAG: MFS transporter [Candidatus Aminicenantes bacterium]|nr:MFS transporter [Candidatus Aminicenantes bacterium]
MVKRRLYKFLKRITPINPGEEIISLLLFFYFFLITLAFGVIKSLRDASYLDKLGPENLPIAYATAIIVGVVVAFHAKLQVKISRRILIIYTLVFSFLMCILFFLLFQTGWKWLPLAYWIWANLVVVLLITQFWITVNDVLNPREAKRMIGFFGSGGILGGIIGGILTGFLAKSNESYALLFIPSVFLMVCIFVVGAVFRWNERRLEEKMPGKEKTRKQKVTETKVGFHVCFDTVRKSSYLKLLALVVVITGIVSTFIDWQSKNIIANWPSIKENLTAFFGIFSAGMLVFAFLLQLLMTSNIIRRFGLGLALLVYPLILFFCSFGIAVWPVIFFAIVIKGADKSLSYSLNQSARELLYIPISPVVKYRAKVFIDMFLNRLAKGVGAGFLLLIFLLPPNLWIISVSIISAFFILVWIILNVKVSREYTNTVKKNLVLKWDRAESLIDRNIDRETTRLVFDLVESRTQSDDLFAMHLFDLIRQGKLTPEIRRFLGYVPENAKVTSVGALFDAQDAGLFFGGEEGLGEEELKKEVEEILSLDVYQQVIKNHFLRITTDVDGSETARMEAAKAIGFMKPDSPLVDKLTVFLDDKSPGVSRYAIESAAKLKLREHVTFMIKKLSDPKLCGDIEDALETYGNLIVGMLADHLGDETMELEVHRSLCSVLARIGTQEAADFFIWEMDEGKSDVETEIIDALHQICSKNPAIRFEEYSVHKKIREKIESYCRSYLEMDENKIVPTEGESAASKDKELEGILTNVFRLLGLVYPREDIDKAFQNIRTGTKNSIAYAIELLDNTLKKDTRDLLIPLIEDISEEEKKERCRTLLKWLKGFKDREDKSRSHH